MGGTSRVDCFAAAGVAVLRILGIRKILNRIVGGGGIKKSTSGGNFDY